MVIISILLALVLAIALYQLVGILTLFPDARLYRLGYQVFKDSYAVRSLDNVYFLKSPINVETNPVSQLLEAPGYYMPEDRIATIKLTHRGKRREVFFPGSPVLRYSNVYTWYWTRKLKKYFDSLGPVENLPDIRDYIAEFYKEEEK